MKPRESGGRQSTSEHEILNAHRFSTGLLPPPPPLFTLLISHLLHLFGMRTFTAQRRHGVFKMAFLSFFGQGKQGPSSRRNRIHSESFILSLWCRVQKLAQVYTYGDLNIFSLTLFSQWASRQFYNIFELLGQVWVLCSGLHVTVWFVCTSQTSLVHGDLSFSVIFFMVLLGRKQTNKQT